MEKTSEKDLLQRMQRDINCLLDQDDYMRKNALKALIQKFKADDTHKDAGRYVYEQHLLKNLVYCIADAKDFNRELALELNMVCITKLSPVSLDAVTRVVEVFLVRMNAIPYPENSDAARKQIILQLKAILTNYKDAFKSCMGAVLDVLSKALLDSYQDVKIDTSELVCQFCNVMPDYISHNSKALVKSLVVNVKHRLKTALTEVLVVPLGGQNFGDAEIAIKTALADKNSDIRESTYALLSACLQRFSYPDLKSFETRIVKHLLTGYSDQTPETRVKIPEYLNICGESRRKLDDEMKSLNN